ncbi:MAG: Rrf2 family transcriptional regulator [Bacteroidales bacterium]|nr:Rrf2 family transcriptional regulator [Bacteroidales bacterium]
MAHIVNFSEAASIALHGMILIARSDEVVNVLKIAETTSSSKHHVAKVMQRLVKDGFLTSQRGPTGGFTLKRKPGDISLLNIYETIEGKIVINHCPHDQEICPFDKCIFNNITMKMTREFVDYMKGQTLEKYL